jgi:hypothetical protein
MGVFRKGRIVMALTRHTSEQIIAKLREAEVNLAQGKQVPAVQRVYGDVQGREVESSWAVP